MDARLPETPQTGCTRLNGCEKKKVILVHAGSHLLPRSKGCAQARSTTYLVSLGVEIHLNQRIVEFDDMLQTYTSSSGEVFSAGKVYTCTGPRANTEALKDAQTDSVIQSALDDKGFVKVDDHLRLHGAPNVFASRRHRRGKDVPHDWTPRRDRKGRTRAHRRFLDRPLLSRRGITS